MLSCTTQKSMAQLDLRCRQECEGATRGGGQYEREMGTHLDVTLGLHSRYMCQAAHGALRNLSNTGHRRALQRQHERQSVAARGDERVCVLFRHPPQEQQCDRLHVRLPMPRPIC